MMHHVAGRVALLALRALVLFLGVAGIALAGLWAAKRWLGWYPPSPFDAIFLERVQQAEPLLYVYDNDTGWKPNPYTQLHFVERAPFRRGESLDARMRTNSEGFFDREHYRETPYYRIAFLGDSWVEAQQVDPTQRFTDLVEGYVHSASKGEKAVETMNFGVSNLGTAQEFGLARAHVAKYRPNEIWVLFNAFDDIIDSSAIFNPPPLGPTFRYADREGGEEIVDLRFGFPDPPAVRQAQRQRRYGDWLAIGAGEIRPYLYARETHPAFDAAFLETRQCLRLLKQLADGIGAKVTVVYLPHKAELEKGPWARFEADATRAARKPLSLDAALGEKRIEAMAREEGAAFLSLKPLMLEKGTHEMLQGHLSRMGHHWVADLIARHLVATDCCKPPAAK